MKFTGLMLAAIAGLSASMQAHAQQFPDGALTPSAADLKKHLDDKVFDVKLADGVAWRLEYKPNGFFFVNTSAGFNSSGQWQAEDGRLCGAVKGRDRTCSDVRLSQGVLHVKRDSGEMIQFLPR